MHNENIQIERSKYLFQLCVVNSQSDRVRSAKTSTQLKRFIMENTLLKIPLSLSDMLDLGSCGCKGV